MASNTADMAQELINEIGGLENPSDTENPAQELIDEIWGLEKLQASKSRGVDVCELYSALLKLKCHFLERSIPENIPRSLFSKLVEIKWLYLLHKWDSTKVDRSLKRGMGDALRYLNSELVRRSEPFNDIDLRLLDVCGKALSLSNLDDEWRNLKERLDATSERFGRTG